MKNWRDFLNYNIKEQLEKAVRTEELTYPLKLIDVSLRTLKPEYIDSAPHYWEIIQIHELLKDYQLLPESYDDTMWYQYISAYLILPRMEELVEINRSAWNDEVEEKNVELIKDAVKTARRLLKSLTLKNKVAEQTSREFGDSLLKNEIHTVLSRRELTYPLNLLEINLRKLETKVQYWTIREIHEILNYEGVLPAEYNYNLWYRYIAAYILIHQIGINKLVDLNRNGWSDSVRTENEMLIFNFDLE
jgi:hypothetical protein